MPLDGVQVMGFDRSNDNLQSLATTTFDSRSGTFLNKCHCGGINNNKGCVGEVKPWTGAFTTTFSY